MNTPAIIRSLGEEDDEQGKPMKSFGIQFGELTQQQRLIIMNLVYQHLLKEGDLMRAIPRPAPARPGPRHAQGRPHRHRHRLACSAHQMRFDLSAGFPLLTTKKLHLKSIIHELLWFLQGDTNIRYLQENGVTIWDEWADADGNLGPVYGYQWRAWRAPDGRPIDQIAQVIEQHQEEPGPPPPHRPRLERRARSTSMALPPCHALFQFYVADGKLSCQLYQRSADIFLGVPFNIASYALLTLMVAQVCGPRSPATSSTPSATCTSTRTTSSRRSCSSPASRAPLPRMKLNPAVKDLFAFQFEDFTLEGYDPHPAIKAPIAV